MVAVGREGVVGLPPLEDDRARSRAVVQSLGTALRLRAALLAYSQALIAEIMQARCVAATIRWSSRWRGSSCSARTTSPARSWR